VVEQEFESDVSKGEGGAWDREEIIPIMETGGWKMELAFCEAEAAKSHRPVGVKNNNNNSFKDLLELLVRDPDRSRDH
jgi:hypothetical protein